jgi:hypothetical protein
MHSIISTLFRGAKRLFGPVWGIRIVNLVLFIYFSVVTITDEGGKRVFAIGGAIFVLVETGLCIHDRRSGDGPSPVRPRWTSVDSCPADQRGPEVSCTAAQYRNPSDCPCPLPSLQGLEATGMTVADRTG